MTLHLNDELYSSVSSGDYRYCETPARPVVYFGPPGTQLLRIADLKTRVGAKEAEDPVPVCYCFSFTERHIIEDVLAHGRCTIRDYIQDKVRREECACEVKNPSGRCCLGNVARAIKKAPEALQRAAATLAR